MNTTPVLIGIVLKTGQRIFISGQIGLIPSHLALPSPPSLAKEMALACQHVTRVTQALQNNASGNWTAHTQLAIYWLASVDNLAHVRRGHTALVVHFRRRFPLMEQSLDFGFFLLKADTITKPDIVCGGEGTPQKRTGGEAGAFTYRQG